MFISLKGGVAKTTSAVAVAECLASEGMRVLVIDADHQCSASELLLGEEQVVRCDKRKTTLYDMLVQMTKDDFEVEEFERFVVPNGSNIIGLKTLSVLPSSLRLDDWQVNRLKARDDLSGDDYVRLWRKRIRQFRLWLSATFHYVIIDCPPSVAIQVKQMLILTDGIVIPSVPDRLSVRGAQFLINRLQKAGFKTPYIGMLWSMARSDVAVHKQYIEFGKVDAPLIQGLPAPFSTVIPHMAAITKAAEDRQCPNTFASKYGVGAKYYRDVCHEIVRRLEWEMPTDSSSKEASSKAQTSSIH